MISLILIFFTSCLVIISYVIRLIVKNDTGEFAIVTFIIGIMVVYILPTSIIIDVCKLFDVKLVNLWAIPLTWGMAVSFTMWAWRSGIIFPTNKSVVDLCIYKLNKTPDDCRLRNNGELLVKHKSKEGIIDEIVVNVNKQLDFYNRHRLVRALILATERNVLRSGN